MADVIVGAKLEADASGYIKSVGDIRKEIKAAEKDVIAMSEKFGITSKEAAAAAAKAADLKDQVQDSKQLIDAFNPDTKFRAFGASIQTVIGGFTALTGVMGLLGVESEEVQKTLLKVQSALALSQGIAQLQEGIGALKNLGTVLVNTLGKSGLIGIAIAGAAALGAALLGAFDGASEATKEYNASLKEMTKGQVEATKEVNATKIAFNQAEAGVISKKEALDKYNTGIGKTIGFAKDLNEAEKLTVENADNYIKVQGLKAQANYLLGKSSELEAKARIAQLDLSKGVQTEIGLFDKLTGKGNEAIQKSKAEAAELMGLVTQINAEIKNASSGFKPPPEEKKTSATKQKEKEVEEISGLQKLLNDINAEAATKEAELHAVRLQQGTDLVVAHAANQQQMTSTEEQQTLARMAIADAEHQHRIEIAAATAQLLDTVADLVGKQTLAGKILAIASATINTYLGVTKALASFSPPVNFIMAAVSLAAGLLAIKNIVAVKIPGKSGGSAPTGAMASAPLVPRIPEATNTRLDQQSLNQIGNATTRAFVVESDVTNNQERIRRLNRAARIG